MESWTGGARQLDPGSDWQRVNSRVHDRHSGGSTFRNDLSVVSDQMAAKLWKNSWDVTAINTAFYVASHCDPWQGAPASFFLQDQWWQVIRVQAGGGGDGEFQCVPSLCTEPGGVDGCGSHVSGDTQISQHFQRFCVLFWNMPTDFTGRMFIKPLPLCAERWHFARGNICPNTQQIISVPGHVYRSVA